MANLIINTSQNVNLHYKIANIGVRLLAFLIDLVIFFAYFYLVDLLMDAFQIRMWDDWTVIGINQLLLLPVMFYSLYMNIIFQGQTVGKMIMKIQVVKLDGTPVSWGDYMVLWAMRLVDIWAFLGSLGFLFIVFSEKSQRIGDHAAGTVVINKKNYVGLDHTLLEEVPQDYTPVFPQVLSLTDKDIRLIKETFSIATKSLDYATLKMLRDKVESILNTHSEMYDSDYLETVLKDYYSLTNSM